MRCSTCDSDPCICPLLGHAAARGCRWADEVAATITQRRLVWRDWPVYGGRAAQRARQLTQDLTRDPKVHEKLARRCFDEGAHWYARRRRGL